MAILSVATILGLGSVASVLADEHPENLLCEASFDAEGAAYDNVEVAPGASCIIENAIIHGNFQSDGGGTLVGPNNSLVMGDVQIKNQPVGTLYGVVESTVLGNVQLEDNFGLGIVNDSIIGGNLQCQKNAVVLIDSLFFGGGNTVVAGDTQCE